MALELTLKPRQLKAIECLLVASSVREAAKASGVSYRTLYRWLGDPLFRAALQRAEGEAIDQAARQLVNLSGPAIMVISEIINDDGFKAETRLRAAQIAADNLVKFHELRNLGARLERLEELIENVSKHQQPNQEA